jgi:hypothetical protein
MFRHHICCSKYGTVAVIWWNNFVKHFRLIGICKSIVSCNSVRKLTWSALRQFPWYLDPGYPKIAQWVDRSLPECCSPPPRYLLGVRLGWEKSGKTLQTR